MGIAEPEWIEGWYVEASAVFGPDAFLTSGSGDGNRWVATQSGGISAIWDLTDGAVYLIEDTGAARLSAESSIATGGGSSCSVEALELCESVGGVQLVDTASGEIYELDSVGRVFLSGDGSSLWSASLPVELDGLVVSWPDGQATELIDLSNQLGLDAGRFTTPRLVSVSTDGESVLYIPPSGEADHASQLSALVPTGEAVSILPIGEAAFAGGAAFSHDGASVLFGTSGGLSVFDLKVGARVAEEVAGDPDAIWVRHGTDAIGLEPGRWVVALTPSNLTSGADLIVAIVEPLAGTCDILGTIRVPSPEPAANIELSLIGGSGSSRIGIHLIDHSQFNQFGQNQSLILDLDERPAGAVVVYELGVWSQAG